ncbi:hypothetical protein, partial [Pseudacidovorax intermedius]|uniref:hypothetical protein n=1 Tax=Pseudacidovorax intermedius TaxID=433924 RepID=UPI001E60B596
SVKARGDQRSVNSGSMGWAGWRCLLIRKLKVRKKGLGCRMRLSEEARLVDAGVVDSALTYPGLQRAGDPFAGHQAL